MKTIGVIVAMNKEMAKLKTIINVTETFEIYNNTFFCGEHNNTKIVLAISGIGKVNAAMTTMLMIANFNPSLIINSGIAGGYATDLEPLDIIVGNKVGYSDVDMTSPIAGAFSYGQIEGMPRFFESQMKYINEKMQEEVKLGTILTGDQFVDSYEKASKIVSRYFPNDNVMACDMESASIAQVSYNCGVDFLIIRVISDVIGRSNKLDYDTFSMLASNKCANLVLEIINNVK